MNLLRKHLKRLFKYAVVGTVGAFLNLGLLYVFTQYLGLWYILSEMGAILISFVANYILNTVWTYRDAMKKLEETKNEI